MEIGIELLTHWGPLAIGWIAAAGLGWVVFRDKNRASPFQKVVDSYHEAIVANTRAMERLATIIEERTRRR